MKNSYNPDGECAAYSLNSLLMFFGDDNVALDRDRADISYFLEVLEPLGFNYIVYSEWTSILKVLLLSMKFGHKKFTFSKCSFFESCSRLKGKRVIVHHGSCYELYGIYDSWSHWITEKVKGEAYKLDDGLADKMKSDPHRVVTRVHSSRGSSLYDIRGCKILVWR